MILLICLCSEIILDLIKDNFTFSVDAMPLTFKRGDFSSILNSLSLTENRELNLPDASGDIVSVVLQTNDTLRLSNGIQIVHSEVSVEKEPDGTTAIGYVENKEATVYSSFYNMSYNFTYPFIDSTYQTIVSAFDNGTDMWFAQVTSQTSTTLWLESTRGAHSDLQTIRITFLSIGRWK